MGSSTAADMPCVSCAGDSGDDRAAEMNEREWWNLVISVEEIMAMDAFLDMEKSMYRRHDGLRCFSIGFCFLTRVTIASLPNFREAGGLRHCDSLPVLLA